MKVGKHTCVCLPTLVILFEKDYFLITFSMRTVPSLMYFFTI